MSRKIKNTMNKAYIKTWYIRHNKEPQCICCGEKIIIGETFASIISSGLVKKLYCKECARRLNIL